MAIIYDPKQNILEETKYILNKFRFGFEKAIVDLEYFPLEDKFFLWAKGKYQIQFDLGYSLTIKWDQRWEFYQKIGLVPIWNDPVC